MFKQTHTFGSFSVNDLQAAKTFYGQTLGLEVEEDTEMGMLTLHMNGGYDYVVYPKPNHSAATFTVLNFVVDDVDKTVADMKAKGVKFESYKEGPVVTDENNIMRDPNGPTIAWFTDPAGNILSVLKPR